MNDYAPSPPISSRRLHTDLDILCTEVYNFAGRKVKSLTTCENEWHHLKFFSSC